MARLCLCETPCELFPHFTSKKIAGLPHSDTTGDCDIGAELVFELMCVVVLRCYDALFCCVVLLYWYL
jgi:hypothetical protein